MSNQSRGSTRTGDYRGSKAAAAKRNAGALNTRGDIQQRRVSVVVFNLTGFHGLSAAGSATAGGPMVSAQSAFLNIIHKHAKENKGVVDVFQGDHVVCTFNAVGYTPAHPKRAAMVALAVLKEVEANPKLPNVTCGISTGSAFVGNMGTDDMRRFCTVGPVVPQAMLLERMCKLYPSAKILFPASMIPDVELEQYYLTLDILRLPGGALPTRICSLIGLKSMEANEWMYELEQGEGSNVYSSLNNAFKAAAAGDREEAKKQLTDFLSRDPKPSVETGKPADDGCRDVEITAVENLSRLVEAADKAGSQPPSGASLGAFYDALLR